MVERRNLAPSFNYFENVKQYINYYSDYEEAYEEKNTNTIKNGMIDTLHLEFCYHVLYFSGASLDSLS